ncbi:Uncharacterized protein FKW44_003409, partial [Caligus rogercresseyi]
RDIWRDSDYIVEIVADPTCIPQIVPYQGFLIKLKFSGVKLQCQRCFNFGHMKHHCTQKRVKIFEYDRALKKGMDERLQKEKNETEASHTPATAVNVRTEEIVELHSPTPPVSRSESPIKDLTERPSSERSLKDVEVIDTGSSNNDFNNDCDDNDIEVEAEKEGDVSTSQNIEIDQDNNIPLSTVPLMEHLTSNGMVLDSRGREKPKKHLASYLNSEAIIKERTRSQSSKRSREVIGKSPTKEVNPQKIQR